MSSPVYTPRLIDSSLADLLTTFPAVLVNGPRAAGKTTFIEPPGAKLIGIEIKASAAPRSSDAKHLRWLRARFPERFVAGAVLHTGPDIIELSNQILALPISSIWA